MDLKCSSMNIFFETSSSMNINPYQTYYNQKKEKKFLAILVAYLDKACFDIRSTKRAQGYCFFHLCIIVS